MLERGMLTRVIDIPGAGTRYANEVHGHRTCWNEVCKTRSFVGKITSAALNSLTRWLRDARAARATGDYTEKLIESDGVLVLNEARPQWHRAWAQSVVDSLFDGTQDWLYYFEEDGTKVPTRFLEDVQQLLSVVRVNEQYLVDGSVCVEGWWFHNYVDPDMVRKYGRPAGSRRFDTDEECLAAVKSICYVWSIGKRWEVAAESRWAHIRKLRARFVLTTISNNFVCRVLQDVQSSWQVNESLTAALERAIGRNDGDYASKRKLKLVKICRALCSPDSSQTMAMLFIGECMIDRIFYSIIGRNGDRRITIFGLCHPRSSPLLEVQEAFVSLLSDFSPANAKWSLLNLVGGNFTCPRLRRSTRIHLIRLDAGVLDYFVIRMARPPYSSLAPGFRGILSDEFIDEKLDDMYAQPVECLPQMVLQLRKKYPRKAQFPVEGCPIVRKWSMTADVAMDFTERSHGQMRQDLQSATRGRSPQTSSERLFCRLLEQVHVARGGRPHGGSKVPVEAIVELGKPKSVANVLHAITDETGDGASLQEQPSAPAMPRNFKSSCGACLRFRSMRLKAYKALYKNNEYSSAQLEEMVSNSWLSVRDDPKQVQDLVALNVSKAMSIEEQAAESASDKTS